MNVLMFFACITVNYCCNRVKMCPKNVLKFDIKTCPNFFSGGVRDLAIASRAVFVVSLGDGNKNQLAASFQPIDDIFFVGFVFP